VIAPGWRALGSIERRLGVFLLKLSMTTLWLAGVVRGWTCLGLWHLLAVAVVVMVFAEGTRVERRIAHAVLHRH
jgi:hypothetical protein